jgi:hypothetical protein
MEEFKAQAARYHMAIDVLHEALDEPPPEMSLLDRLVGATFQDEPGVVCEEPYVDPWDGEGVPENPEPFSEEPEGREEPQVFDLSRVREGLRLAHIYYPVKPCHRNFLTFYRQVLLGHVIDHPGYKAYVDAGGLPLHGIWNRTWKNAVTAADELGIDREALYRETLVLHHMIFKLGTEGVDFLPVNELETA